MKTELKRKLKKNANGNKKNENEIKNYARSQTRN